MHDTKLRNLPNHKVKRADEHSKRQVWSKMRGTGAAWRRWRKKPPVSNMSNSPKRRDIGESGGGLLPRIALLSGLSIWLHAIIEISPTKPRHVRNHGRPTLEPTAFWKWPCAWQRSPADLKHVSASMIRNRETPLCGVAITLNHRIPRNVAVKSTVTSSERCQFMAKG